MCMARIGFVCWDDYGEPPPRDTHGSKHFQYLGRYEGTTSVFEILVRTPYKQLVCSRFDRHKSTDSGSKRSFWQYSLRGDDCDDDWTAGPDDSGMRGTWGVDGSDMESFRLPSHGFFLIYPLFVEVPPNTPHAQQSRFGVEDIHLPPETAGISPIACYSSMIPGHFVQDHGVLLYFYVQLHQSDASTAAARSPRGLAAVPAREHGSGVNEASWGDCSRGVA